MERAKRGWKVSVLLTSEMEQAMELFVERKKKLKVNPANPCPFATPTSLTCIHPWDCLHRMHASYTSLFFFTSVHKGLHY